MKKRNKRILSVMLAIAVIVSTFSGAVPARKASAAVSTTSIIPAKVTDFMAQPMYATTTITLLGSNGSTTTTVDNTSMIVPVVMDYSGTLELGFKTSGLPGSIDIALYSDQTCTQKVGSSAYLSSSAPAVVREYMIPAAATYYLKLSWSISVPQTSTNIEILSYGYSGEELTLSSQLQAVYTSDATNPRYHKLEMKNDGVAIIEGQEFDSNGAPMSSLSFQLCDSNKMSIEEGYLSSSDNYIASYALKKGTYYVAIKTAYKYQIAAVASSAKDKAGASRKKARKISRGKTVNGIVFLSDGTSKVDWFKLKLPKNSKMKLNVSMVGSGRLRFEVIPASRNYHLYNNAFYMETGKKAITTKKIRKGTYYIKVTKVSSSYSGAYSIKYKK